MPFADLSPSEALSHLEGRRADDTQTVADSPDPEVVVLDVRTFPEWVGGHIPGAVHIPLHELPGRWRELNPEAKTLVICQHGVRSMHACDWLAGAGFEDLANIRYGMSRWPGPVERGP